MGMHEPEQSASNELFQTSIEENQGKTFSVSIYSVRRAHWCNSDTPTLHLWENIKALSRNPLTLNNFLLSPRPESRQILQG